MGIHNLSITLQKALKVWLRKIVTRLLYPIILIVTAKKGLGTTSRGSHRYVNNCRIDIRLSVCCFILSGVHVFPRCLDHLTIFKQPLKLKSYCLKIPLSVEAVKAIQSTGQKQYAKSGKIGHLFPDLGTFAGDLQLMNLGKRGFIY